MLGGQAISLQNRDNSGGALWENGNVKAALKAKMENGGSKMAGVWVHRLSSILAAVLTSLR